MQHGSHLGERAELSHLGLVVARRARDEGGTRTAHVRRHRGQRCHIGEIHKHIGCGGVISSTQVKADLGHNLERRLVRLGAGGLGGGANERAHASLTHDGESDGAGRRLAARGDALLARATQ